MENQALQTTNDNGNNLPAVNSGVQLENTIIGKNSQSLAATILDSIEQVKKNPNYIPQAEAINSQVKSLIDLGKAEIEGFKVAAFMSQGR